MRRRWLLAGMVGLAAAAGACAALVGLRYYPAYRSALAGRDDLRAAQTLLRERRLDASEADLALAESRLDEADRELRQARGVLNDPLLRAGGHLPLAGGAIDSSGQLTDIGLDGVALGRDLVAAARTYQDLRQEDAGALGGRADDILDALDPAMAEVAQRVDGMQERRAGLDGPVLVPGLADALSELDRDLAELDELTDTYEALSAFVPAFLGFDGPRTYLVLAQNNAELMPTGGLISVYGTVTVRDGEVVERDFADAIALGASWTEDGGYVAPPGPLGRYLLREQSWSLSTSNWSPDAPTAAREAERFYARATGRAVDGVIAINVRTIEELLRVTGTVDVPGYEITVSAEDALDVIEAHTRADVGDGRKAFVGALAEELLARLSELPSDDWSALIDALQRLRNERQLFFNTSDASLEASAVELGLDGSLADAPGDYQMVVDASVGSTKLNVALDQRIGIEVHLDRAGAAQHRTTLWYHNDLPPWAEGRDSALVRDLMGSGVYGGYVRVLAPAGSALESVYLDGSEVGAEEVKSEAGKVSFGRFFALPSGANAELTFRYATDGVVRDDGGVREYRLHLQKQSGTGAVPTYLSVRLPAGARLVSAELDGAPLERLGGIATDLRRDRELVVRYRLEE